MDEKTQILDSDSNEPLPENMNKEEKPNEPMAVQEAGIENEKKKTETKSKAKIIAAAAAGFVGGAGAAYTAMEILNPRVTFPGASAAPAPSVNLPPVNEIKPEASVATQVNDNMSFDEAFAAARHETGQGGVFLWRGELFNTYYKEEWNAMTPEQKSEFVHSLDYKDITTAPSTLGQQPIQPDNVVQSIPEPVNQEQTETHQTSPSPLPHESSSQPAVPEPLPEPETQPIPVEPQPLEPEIISVSFDEKGDSVFSIDLDHDALADAYIMHHQQDEIFDVVMIDLDHDDIPDQVPTIIPSDQVINQADFDPSIQDVSHLVSKEDPDHIPDYHADADPSEFEHHI